ncbi:copper-binding protein [Pseudomonas sp. Marseille-Q8238]
MKTILTAIAGGLVVALALSAQAQGMQEMEGMQATQRAPVAKAEGVIKTVDLTGHSVTIAHGAVPSLQWPPMTMPFAATEEQLAGLKSGDAVTFTFRIEGGRAVIDSIKK